jgi:alkylglycerol monooxygenase
VEESYLALAVPVFVVSIAGEAWVSRRKGLGFYRLHDTIGSLGCGIGQTLLGLWVNVFAIAVYVFVARAAPWKLPADSAVIWGLSLVGVDFCHYWFHRSSHRINFLWAGHAVHHQSEDYNLSTALRQSWLEPIMSVPFYLPLALLGVPVEVFVATHTIQTLYQYWIHTRVIGKLGVVDGVLNTPSNHRVHHAINPEYIDKNYAGIFILWDRIFGTWVEEKAEPAYGLVKPLASFDPYWSNLSEWARIAALANASKSRLESWYAVIAPPEWLPRSLGGAKAVPPVDPARVLYEANASRAVDGYVVAQFALVLAGSGALLGVAHGIDPIWRGAAIVWLLSALWTLPRMFEKPAASQTIETARILAAPVVLGGLLGIGGLLGGVAFVVSSLLMKPARA